MERVFTFLVRQTDEGGEDEGGDGDESEERRGRLAVPRLLLLTCHDVWDEVGPSEGQQKADPLSIVFDLLFFLFHPNRPLFGWPDTLQWLRRQGESCALLRVRQSGLEMRLGWVSRLAVGHREGASLRATTPRIPEVLAFRSLVRSPLPPLENPMRPSKLVAGARDFAVFVLCSALCVAQIGLHGDPTASARQPQLSRKLMLDSQKVPLLLLSVAVCASGSRRRRREPLILRDRLRVVVSTRSTRLSGLTRSSRSRHRNCPTQPRYMSARRFK